MGIVNTININEKKAGNTCQGPRKFEVQVILDRYDIVINQISPDVTYFNWFQ